jgi:hypothetical protein
MFEALPYLDYLIVPYCYNLAASTVCIFVGGTGLDYSINSYWFALFKAQKIFALLEQQHNAIHLLEFAFLQYYANFS